MLLFLQTVVICILKVSYCTFALASDINALHDLYQRKEYAEFIYLFVTLFQVVLVHGYLQSLYFESRAAPWDGAGKRQRWMMKPLLIKLLSVSVHSPSPARNSDSWWSVRWTIVDAGNGVRTPTCV
jgi:hypothetical protein